MAIRRRPSEVRSVLAQKMGTTQSNRRRAEVIGGLCVVQQLSGCNRHIVAKIRSIRRLRIERRLLTDWRLWVERRARVSLLRTKRIQHLRADRRARVSLLRPKRPTTTVSGRRLHVCRARGGRHHAQLRQGHRNLCLCCPALFVQAISLTQLLAVDRTANVQTRWGAV